MTYGERMYEVRESQRVIVLSREIRRAKNWRDKSPKESLNLGTLYYCEIYARRRV